MARRMQVWLNGVSLTDAVPSVIIRNVYEDDPENDLVTGERPGYPGQRIISRKRTQLVIRIEIALRILHDLRARAKALQDVCAWAQDGILELSNRPDQRLQCIVTKRPALNTDRNYTQLMNIDLTAIAIPYWENILPDTVSATGTSGSLTLIPSGSVDKIPLEFKVTPSAAALTSFSASVNGYTISLSGLNVAAGKTLALYYDSNALQWITNDGTSVIGSRSAASDDDLWVYPNQTNTITYTAGTSSAVTFEARGRWL